MVGKRHVKGFLVFFFLFLAGKGNVMEKSMGLKEGARDYHRQLIGIS